MGEASPARPPRQRRPAGRLKRLERRIDRALAKLDPWTNRADRAAKFIAAIAALVIAIGAFGATRCSPGPEPTSGPGGSGVAVVTPTPTPAGSASVTPPASQSPGVDPTPSPTPQPPAEHRLRWVDTKDGTSIDGSLLEAGTHVWLQERFPTDPPSGFDVLPVIDPALEPSLGEVEPVTDFDADVSGFTAHSDTDWLLPNPPPSAGSISYLFRDDGGRESREIRVGTVAALALKLDAPSAGQPLQETLSIDEDVEIGVDVAFLDDADVGIQLLTPWDEGELSIQEFVRAYFEDVTLEPAVAEAATQRFLEANADLLPGQQPEGWGFAMEPGAFSGQANERKEFAMTGSVGSAGNALLAIRLVDQGDPSRVAVSRIFRLEAVGPDEPPAVTVVSPESFGAGTTLNLSGDGSSLFARVQLQADIDDADGPIPDDAIVWTTDRGDLQPNGEVLGTSDFLITELYAASCEGALHLVTLTVDDGDGHTVTEEGEIQLVCAD